MRRAAHAPLALLLAVSTVSLLAFTGCDGTESSLADKRVSQEIRTAYTTDNPLDALKKAAGEDKASGASRARAKAMLADAELLAASNQMRQIDQIDNRIATLIWELGQLGQSIQTSSRLIDAYRSYDPSVVQQAAEAHIAETKGDKITIQHINATIPGLAAVTQKIQQLQDSIDKQKQQIAQLTNQRTALMQQADQASEQSENAKGQESVDAFSKASNLRKEAALLSNQIDTANSGLARLNSDLATQQGQQEILVNLVKEYQAGANATDKGFKAVAAEEEAQQNLIKQIYGSAASAPKAGVLPASIPSNIHTRSAQLAAVVEQTDQLYTQALDNLNNAIQHYTEAQQAAEDFQRSINERLSAPGAAEAPQHVAWEDLKKLVNPVAYQLQKSVALQTLGSLYASHAQTLADRIHLASSLSKALHAAELKLPADLAVKDGAAQLKEAHENTDKTFSAASDMQDNVLDAPLGTDSQKASARVAKILTLYAWGDAQAFAGNMAEARKHRLASIELVKAAVADNVTLPALPPEIAPAPKVTMTPAATTSPAH